MANWKDLKSTFELPRNNEATGKWLSNGFRVEHDSAAFYSANFPANFPKGEDERTVEVIFRTPDEHNMFQQQSGVRREIFRYGTYSTLNSFGVIYRGIRTTDYGSGEGVDPNACLGNNRWVFYPIYGYYHNLITCLNSTPSLETPDTINTVTSTYKNSINDAQYTNAYINNTPAVVAARQGGGRLNTLQGLLLIGKNLAHSTFLSVRLYDRVLTSEEIAKNAALDQKRYLSPPTVTIGGKACTEVVVLSKNILMCRVPEGDAVGENIGVTLNGEPYSRYKYVDPTQDFYISKISPIAGPANAQANLTLEGNLLNTITGVEVEGTNCPFIASELGEDASKIRRYVLPAHAAGEVDIIVTAGGQAYRFAKVFEYQ
jgi:hypothetical protein